MPTLTIRKEQMDAFSGELEKRYANRLIDYLQQHFPEASKTPPVQMRMAVKKQIANARSYRLTTERQIATYVIAAWLMGPEFDTKFTAVQDILTSDKTAERKSKWLADTTKNVFRQLRKGA